MTSSIDKLRAYTKALQEGDLARASQLTREHVPLHGRMGLTILKQEGVGAVVAMELGDEVRGFAEGSIHGGMLATLADVTSAFSLEGAYDRESDMPVTTDMHVRYYRQPRSGPVTAEANVVHRGRRLLSTECSVVDGEQRVLARSTATYMLVPHGHGGE